YLAALSNALWYELKPLGIRVTTLLPGPIETGFAQTGRLTQTRLFALGTGVAPQIVVRAGYAGLLAGKRQVIVGMARWMRWAARVDPGLPNRWVLAVIAALQRPRP